MTLARPAQKGAVMGDWLQGMWTLLDRYVWKFAGRWEENFTEEQNCVEKIT